MRRHKWIIIDALPLLLLIPHATKAINCWIDPGGRKSLNGSLIEGLMSAAAAAYDPVDEDYEFVVDRREWADEEVPAEWQWDPPPSPIHAFMDAGRRPRREKYIHKCPAHDTHCAIYQCQNKQTGEGSVRRRCMELSPNVEPQRVCEKINQNCEEKEGKPSCNICDEGEFCNSEFAQPDEEDDDYDDQDNNNNNNVPPTSAAAARWSTMMAQQQCCLLPLLLVLHFLSFYWL